MKKQWKSEDGNQNSFLSVLAPFWNAFESTLGIKIPSKIESKFNYDFGRQKVRLGADLGAQGATPWKNPPPKRAAGGRGARAPDCGKMRIWLQKQHFRLEGMQIPFFVILRGR